MDFWFHEVNQTSTGFLICNEDKLKDNELILMKKDENHEDMSMKLSPMAN